MKNLGKHLLGELTGCDNNILNDVNLIQKEMENAAILANATIVQSVFHTFNPYGVSGVVVIAESHLTIHTWPEYGYAAVDVFTCGDTADPDIAFQHLQEALKADKCDLTEINRGIPEPEVIDFKKPGQEMVYQST